MGRKTLGLLLASCFLASATLAATSPSSPFTAVNNDGRPMTGATVTIVDELGMPAVAWADAQGTQAYSKVVPSTGIVQFFADPKTYIVTVSGSGVTRQFYIDLTGGGGTGEGGGGGGLTEADFGPGDGLLRKLGSDSFGLVKFVSDGLGAPGSSQDSQRGYSVGSFWVDTVANKSYQCISAAPGAAVWKQISNDVSSGGGSGNIDNGIANYQVPYWIGLKWVPGSALWTNGAHVGIGPEGIVDTSASLQVSRDLGSPNIFMWNAQSNITTGTEFGEIDFGATDSSPTPRKGISIVARAIGAWGTNTNSAPSSLDFRVQDGNGGDFLHSYNALRIVGGKVIAGSGIPDTPTTSEVTAFSTSGIDIYDAIGGNAISLLTPFGLLNNLTLSLPNSTGTSGDALITDGGSPNATLHWGKVAAGLHAATHNIGGTDETATYDKVYDEAVALPQRRELAFVGAGVTCADTSGKTTCTVANSGGGSGITSINTDTSAAQTLTVGSTGIDFGIVHNLAGGHIFNIPNASATARGFMDITPQTFAGAKTFIDPFITSVGATFNNNGAAVNFVVKSDNNNNAIFVDGAGDSVGIMTSQPNQIFAPGTSLGVTGLIGKNGITVLASSGQDGLVAFGNGVGAAVHGYGASGAGSAIFGESTFQSAMAGRFERNLAGTVPMVQIKNLNNGETQSLLDLYGGYGQYQISGHNATSTNPNWGIDANGQILSGFVFGAPDPMLASLYQPDTGFYIDSTFPGLSVLGDSGFHLEDMGGSLEPRAQFTASEFKVNSFGLPTANSYLATFKHSGAGNGVFVDNSLAGASAIGLKVQGGNDILSTTAGRFDINMGTAVDARQTGAAASSSTAPTLRVTRETTLTGGAAFSGAVAQIVDGSGSGSTGRLIDIQKPSNVSKFFINGDGSTTIDNSTGVASSALTVKGANAAGSAKGALFTAGTGNIVDIKQTGVAAAGSFDPVFRVTKDMTFTAGNLSSGAVILGIDGTTGTAGVGRLIDLQKPEGTSKFFVNGDGSTNIDTSLTPGVTGLTVKGSNAQGDAKAALFTSVAGNTVLIKQTGVSAAGVSSFDPTLSVVKDMTFTGGNLSTGALIQGVDATGVTGLGYLFQLQQPLGTDRFLVTRTGELNFAGVAADGAGKVLCVKPAGGDIGTCTSAVSAAGVCTCA